MNLQQIPRSNLEIKPMFKTPSASEKIEEVENKIILNPYDSIKIKGKGWVHARELVLEDEIIEEESSQSLKILKLEEKSNQYIIWF